MRNVFVMHSFCESAHNEIGSKFFDNSLMDLETEFIEIEVNTRDRVLNPAQITNLLLFNSSLSISRNELSLSTLHMILGLICVGFPLKILEI